uniref:Uncharacterized protein n=1 Tax=Anguilla anguilla TaxID=7936 RepID=A0A0E9Q0L1_ANGAN
MQAFPRSDCELQAKYVLQSFIARKINLLTLQGYLLSRCGVCITYEVKKSTLNGLWPYY